MLAPRQYEHHPPVDRRSERHGVRVTDPRSRHSNVRALGEPEERLCVRIVAPPQIVHPRTSGVDDHQGPDRARRVGERIADCGPADVAVGLEQARDFGIVGDQRAGLRRAPHGREHQPHVVGLRVVVQRGPLQALGAQPGFQARDARAAKPAVQVHVAEHGERVVQPHPQLQLPRRHARAEIHRKQKREGTDQVGRDAEQNAALVRCLEHEVEVAVLEVTEPAMDQTRRVRGRGCPEVAPIDQCGPDAAQCRIARDPGARDAPADNQQVHRFVRHGRERTGACCLGKRRFHPQPPFDLARRRA